MATVVQVHLSTIVVVLLLWMVWYYIEAWVHETFTEIHHNYVTSTKLGIEIRQIHNDKVHTCMDTCCGPDLDTVLRGIEGLNKRWRTVNNVLSTCLQRCKFEEKVRETWNGLWGHTEL